MILKWLDTHGRHVVNLSLYSGAAAYALQCAKPKSTTSSTYKDWSSAVLSLVCAGLAGFSFWAEFSYFLKRLRLPPGDSGAPLVGHFLSWIMRPRHFIATRLTKHNGGPFTMNFLMNPTLVFSKEDEVRWVMTQERKGNLRANAPDFMLELIGRQSIVFKSGGDHKALRRIFEPSFSPAAVKGYAKTIDQITQWQLQQWCDKGEFQTSSDWAKLAMRLFFECAFEHANEEQLQKFHENFMDWLVGIVAWIPIPIPGNCFHKAMKARDELYKDIQRMVHEFKENNPPGCSSENTCMMGRLCYATDEEGQYLSEDVLIQNLMLLMFAGHDTTKGSFGAFAHYLVENPKVCAMLREEVQSFAEPLNIDELKTAPILNAFLAECWRLVPPTDTHIMEAATDLEYNGYTIPKGVGVLIDIGGHGILNEERFPDAREFKLERWLPKDHPLHSPKYFADVDYNLMSPKFRAFNMGAHQCLGAHFAKLESRIVVARMIQRYDIQIKNERLDETPLLQYANEFKLTQL